MIVVGGTYQETCRDPYFLAMLGSGLRAAACLALVEPAVQLHSAVEHASFEVARATAAGLSLNGPVWSERSTAVGFHYETPLSSPRLFGRESRLIEPIDVAADTVLAFGMVEGPAGVQAQSLIVDPQHDIGLDALKAFDPKRLALLASGPEIVSLGGGLSVEASAAALLDMLPADVVIAKLGALGALVVTRDGSEGVGPRPTARTWPIGSGDAFSAGFAWAWGSQGAAAVEAARVGSAAAAAWCSTQTLPLPQQAFTQYPSALRRRPRVYLAGPFFDVAQRWLVDLAARSLTQLGAEVFSPFHEVGIGGTDVAALDLAGLAHCDSVLALLDGLDAGTVFEVGWATCAEMPVVAFCQRCDEADLTMVGGSGTVVYDDLSSAVYAAVWAGSE